MTGSPVTATAATTAPDPGPDASLAVWVGLAVAAGATSLVALIPVSVNAPSPVAFQWAVSPSTQPAFTTVPGHRQRVVHHEQMTGTSGSTQEAWTDRDREGDHRWRGETDAPSLVPVLGSKNGSELFSVIV